MYRLILCPPCAKKHIDENGDPDQGFLLAMFGPQGLTGEDEAVLITMQVHEEDLLFESRHPGMTLAVCDGCQHKLAVSRSSQWFLDEKQKLEAILH